MTLTIPDYVVSQPPTDRGTERALGRTVLKLICSKFIDRSLARTRGKCL